MFYDENKENLIIITAEVVTKADAADTSLTLPTPVDGFVFRMDQPEKKSSNVIERKIKDLIDPSEFG